MQACGASSVRITRAHALGRRLLRFVPFIAELDHLTLDIVPEALHARGGVRRSGGHALRRGPEEQRRAGR